MRKEHQKAELPLLPIIRALPFGKVLQAEPLLTVVNIAIALQAYSQARETLRNSSLLFFSTMRRINHGIGSRQSADVESVGVRQCFPPAHRLTRQPFWTNIAFHSHPREVNERRKKSLGERGVINPSARVLSSNFRTQKTCRVVHIAERK
jgi:hypothetical protein